VRALAFADPVTGASPGVRLESFKLLLLLCYRLLNQFEVRHCTQSTKPSFVQHPEFYLLRSPRRIYRYNTAKSDVIAAIIRAAAVVVRRGNQIVSAKTSP
jgi:hypothetical protein